MEILLLGTAAAEGWPAPFCVCDSCQEARRRGGLNLRGRSGALIDDVLKIDFGPDTLGQMQRTGRHLASLRTIVFTHQHSDHVAASELQWMVKPFSMTPPPKIEICGNSQVLELLRHAWVDVPERAESMVLRRVEAGDRFITGNGEEVWALAADHAQGAIVLRIRRNGKTLFYGHDSGCYPPATLDALSDEIVLDAVILDCTSGGLRTPNRQHMGVDGVIRMVEELRRRGAIGDRTRTIATHFSHNGGMLHEELVRALLPHRIETAFDGMIVTV